jgi:MYXO-CTERM domain-containing protein
MAAAFVGAVALTAPPAAAIPMPAGSQLDFTGTIHPLGGTNIYSSTGADFRTDGVNSPGVPGTTFVSNSNTGAFSVFNPFTCPSSGVGGCGTIIDLLSYGPGANTLNNPTLPVNDFLTFSEGGLSATFNLSNFTYTETQPTSNGLGQLEIQGFGAISMAGYATTNAIMTLTAQGPLDTSFSGSVVSQGSVVPEPASMMIMFAGLLGLGAVGGLRRRTTATS